MLGLIDTPYTYTYEQSVNINFIKSFYKMIVVRGSLFEKERTGNRT